MEKNLLNKTRKTEDPYMTFTRPGWEWRVLRAYQTREKELANPFARWFLATKSPFTYRDWELGDGYAKDIVKNATLIFASPEALAAGYPSPFQQVPPTGAENGSLWRREVENPL